MNKIAVVIINHNTCGLLRACLASLVPEAPPQIIVVDNASTDDSRAMLEAEYPDVTLVANDDNPGYGAASNQGIQRTTTSYVLLLNSDTRLQPGALSALSTYLDDLPRVAIAGPRMLNPDGTLQPSAFPFPTPSHVFIDLSGLRVVLRQVPLLGELYLPTSSHVHARAVPWVLGAALAIRRSAFELVGGFDESFFMYSEETDLCYRLRQAGWDIHLAPVTEIEHVGGASTRQRRGAMVRQLYVSIQSFYNRHYSRRVLLQLKAIMTLGMLMKAARDRLRLIVVTDIGQRARITEDLAVWKGVLIDLWLPKI